MRASDREHGVLFIGSMRTHLELYAPKFQADPRVSIIGVTEEPDAGAETLRLSREAADWLDVPFLPDYDAALADPRVTIVCATPAIERRARVLMRSARAGKHLYLDKPIVATPQELAAVKTVFRGNDRTHRVYSFAEAPWLAAARETVRSGELGAITGIHVSILFAKGRQDSGLPANRDETARPTYTFFDAKRDLAEIGFYGLSAIVHLGGARAEQVFARTGNYFFTAHREHDIEDFGTILVRAGGIVGTVTAGRYGSVSHAQDGIQQIRLVGTSGVAEFDAWSPRLSVNVAPPEQAAVNPIDPLSMWPSTTTAPAARRWVSDTQTTDWALLDVARFLDDIASGDDSGLGIAHAIHVNEITLAAYESARTRSPVDVRGFMADQSS